MRRINIAEHAPDQMSFLDEESRVRVLFQDALCLDSKESEEHGKYRFKTLSDMQFDSVSKTESPHDRLGNRLLIINPDELMPQQLQNLRDSGFYQSTFGAAGDWEKAFTTAIGSWDQRRMSGIITQAKETLSKLYKAAQAPEARMLFERYVISPDAVANWLLPHMGIEAPSGVNDPDQVTEEMAKFIQMVGQTSVPMRDRAPTFQKAKEAFASLQTSALEPDDALQVALQAMRTNVLLSDNATFVTYMPHVSTSNIGRVHGKRAFVLADKPTNETNFNAAFLEETFHIIDEELGLSERPEWIEAVKKEAERTVDSGTQENNAETACNLLRERCGFEKGHLFGKQKQYEAGNIASELLAEMFELEHYGALTTDEMKSYFLADTVGIYCGMKEEIAEFAEKSRTLIAQEAKSVHRG